MWMMTVPNYGDCLKYVAKTGRRTDRLGGWIWYQVDYNFYLGSSYKGDNDGIITFVRSREAGHLARRGGCTKNKTVSIEHSYLYFHWCLLIYRESALNKGDYFSMSRIGCHNEIVIIVTVEKQKKKKTSLQVDNLHRLDLCPETTFMSSSSWSSEPYGYSGCWFRYLPTMSRDVEYDDGCSIFFKTCI